MPSCCFLPLDRSEKGRFVDILKYYRIWEFTRRRAVPVVGCDAMCRQKAGIKKKNAAFNKTGLRSKGFIKQVPDLTWKCIPGHVTATAALFERAFPFSSISCMTVNTGPPTAVSALSTLNRGAISVENISFLWSPFTNIRSRKEQGWHMLKSAYLTTWQA